MAVLNNKNEWVSYNCSRLISQLEKDIEKGVEYVDFVYVIRDNVEIPAIYFPASENSSMREFTKDGAYESCQILAISLLQYLQTLNSDI